MGLIRLFLALVVVEGHFANCCLVTDNLYIPNYYFLGMNAGFAVMFFYIISGFLISGALSHKYPPTMSGSLQFYHGRFFRIFALYWPLLALNFVIDAPSFFHASFADNLTKFFLLGADWRVAFAHYPNLGFEATPSLMNPAWTLGAELMFYSLAPFVLRSWILVITVLALSATTRAYFVYRYGHDVVWTYTFFPSTFVFFMIGHLVQSSSKWRPTRNPIIGLALLSGAAVAMAVPNAAYWDSPRFWLAVILFSASLPAVFDSTRNSKVMNSLGDLSYPVYLVQIFVMKAIAPALVHATNGPEWKNWPQLALFRVGVVLVAVSVSAFAADYFIGRPITGVMKRLFAEWVSPSKLRDETVAARANASVVLPVRTSFFVSIGAICASMIAVWLSNWLSKAPEGTIEVKQAIYGQNCGVSWGNATKALSDACKGAKTCSFDVSALPITDPAPGCEKNFYVEYSCSIHGPTLRDSIFVGASNGVRALLNCNPGIRIVSATYGGNCGAPIGNATSEVIKACADKQTCTYFPDYHTLGDPANGCGKDFSLEYTCTAGGTVQNLSIPGEAGMGNKAASLVCQGVSSNN